jgi:hypothetical protein
VKPLEFEGIENGISIHHSGVSVITGTCFVSLILPRPIGELYMIQGNKASPTKIRSALEFNGITSPIEYGASHGHRHVFGCKDSDITLIYDSNAKSWEAVNNDGYKLHGSYGDVLLLVKEVNTSRYVKFITVNGNVSSPLAELVIGMDQFSELGYITDSRPFKVIGGKVFKVLASHILVVEGNSVRKICFKNEYEKECKYVRTVEGKFVIRKIKVDGNSEMIDEILPVENERHHQNLLLFVCKHNVNAGSLPIDMVKEVYKHVSAQTSPNKN